MWKRQQKECGGCGETFLTFRNYDYCPDCTLNGSRYLNKSNQCSECGDGSGWIKFKGSPKRPCKLCALSKKSMNSKTKTEKFWDQVDLLAQEKIYQLCIDNIPLPHLKLITEAYRYEDKQEKLTGLFLHKDVDYRTLLADIENQYYEAEKPDKEVLAEEVTLWYCRMVVKALIQSVSDYGSYDPSYFENLTN